LRPFAIDGAARRSTVRERLAIAEAVENGGIGP